MGGQDRNFILTTAGFLSVGVAALAIVLTPTPTGPWEGMYVSYAPTWVLLLASAVLILWRVQRGRFSWPVLFLWGLLFSFTVGALSLQWGWVYGHHDPWAHLARIKFRILEFSRNQYPAFHVWNITVGNITGVAGTTVLRYSALIATLIGTLGLMTVLRVLPVDRVASQRAFVAGLPALFLGFIPRPFTLGWAFVLFFAWAVFAPLSQRRAIGFLMLLGAGLTALHPQVPFFVSAFLLAGFVVELARPHLPSSFRETDITFVARQLIGIISVYGMVVVAYFFFLTESGDRIVNELIDFGSSGGESTVSTPTETDTPTPTPDPQPTPESDGVDNSPTIRTPSRIERRATKVSQLQKIVRQPSLITELLARISFIIVLGSMTLVSAFEELREHRIATPATVALVVAGMYGVFFIFADLVLNKLNLVSGQRIVFVLPAVLIPGIAVVLRRRPGRVPVVGLGLALLVLVSGLAVTYPSDFTGSNTQAATSQQVSGVDWIGTYAHNESVTGTGMTFWILEGRFGNERMLELSPTTGSPKTYVTRRVGFSWQVRNPSGLIVVDGFSRAMARQEVKESGDPTPIRDLETMPIRYSRIYTNGGTDIYGNRSVA